MMCSWKKILSVLIIAYFAACSPVAFELAPPPPCVGDGIECEQVCEGFECLQTLKIERRLGEGLVDILFIIDNSGSMSYEHHHMAQRFQHFLPSIAHLDYRIFMITTDVSSRYSQTPIGVRNDPREINQHGKLQDGHPIRFGNGLYYLDRSTPNKVELFKHAVQRPETLTCENSHFVNCPSDDERGIFTANLFLLNHSKNLLRPFVGHLAIVLLSDQDVRGLSDERSVQTETEAQRKHDLALMEAYPLEKMDMPETLKYNVNALYPEKTMAFHSIIIKPGDRQCLASQQAQGGNIWIRGVEGFLYAKMSELTDGSITSICSDDYAQNLTTIGYSINERIHSINIPCEPLPNSLTVKAIDRNGHPIVPVYWNFRGGLSELEITTELPPLTRITVELQCKVHISGK